MSNGFMNAPVFKYNVSGLIIKVCQCLLFFAIISVLFTVNIYSKNLYNGVVSAKQFWFYGAMAMLIFVTGISLLFIRRSSEIRLNAIDISLLLFYVYFFIRAACTPYTPLIHNTRFLNYTLLVIFYFIVKSFFSEPVDKEDEVSNSNRKIILTEILIVFLMLTGFVQAVLGLLQLYGVLGSFHSGFKITGTFFNPAPYALYLAAIFPIALSRMLLGAKPKRRAVDLVGEKDKLSVNSGLKALNSLLLDAKAFFHEIDIFTVLSEVSYYVSVLTLISILLILPATMNRASWVGVAISSLYIFNKRYDLVLKAKTALNSVRKRLTFFTMLILLLGFSATGLFYLKEGSSDGRLLIWEVTLGKISQRPLFGYGVGRFEAEYNNWQAEYFQNHPDEQNGTKGMLAGNTKYCFNEYLEMTSELGIMGTLLFIMILGSVFHRLKRPKPEQLSDKNFNDNFGISSLIIPALVSLIICALISFPFYSLPTAVLCFMFLAFLSSKVKCSFLESKEFVLSIGRRSAKIIACFIFISGFVLTFGITLPKIYAFCRWREAEQLYLNGHYKKSCILFSNAYMDLQYSGAYLQYYGKALSFNEETSISIKMLESAKIYTSDEMLYSSLGDSYKAQKKYFKSEEAYLFSSYMVPNKLYPKYLLVKLYVDSDQKGKAIETAKIIINGRVKIKSDATEDIINQMYNIIESCDKDYDK